MTKKFENSRRDMMKLTLGVSGAVAGMAVAGANIREAHAQLLKSGISPDSVLARIKKDNKLVVGYSQTVPWFHKSAKTGNLTGIYYDVCEKLAQALEVEAEYHEISWANSTV